MMMRLSRPFGLLAATSALLGTAHAFQGGNVEALFQQGLQALERDDQEAAARAFRGVLAADPSNAQAYELWQSLEDDQWLELLTQEGQIELAARRILERARAGRQELRNDAGAIRALLGELEGAAEDALRRREIAATLGAKHGEFAVPFMLSGLASAGERSGLMAAAMVQMGHRVVPPLLAALEAADAGIRQGAAFVLGEIGDRRAMGSLLAVSQSDEDAGVRQAAADALEALVAAEISVAPGSSAADVLVLEGLDYAFERESVLSPYDYSDVVWRIDGNSLVGVPTPSPFYALEVAKRRFMRALSVDATSRGGRAGLALVGAKAVIKAETIERMGGDVSDMQSRLQHGHLQALAVGSVALDSALGHATSVGDEAAMIGIMRAMAASGAGGRNLAAAAASGADLRLRGEAACALASSMLNGGKAIGGVVDTLGDLVGQEVLRQVLVIDGDDARREALVKSIESIPGTAAVPANSGGAGLRLLLDVERADAILVANVLPDITADAVVAQIGRRSKLASAKVMIIGADEGLDWGDRVDFTVTGASDVLTALNSALDTDLDAPQQLANELAARAASALHSLAAAGRAELGNAVQGLISGAGRELDAVAVPALGALGLIGSAEALEIATGVATDGSRSTEARVAAAQCLAGLMRAGARPTREQLGAVIDVLATGTDGDVRAALAAAIGGIGGDNLAELQVRLLQDLDGVAAE
jgi:DNA-binding PadR family transcriptional regulator/CheY-like chemotaxis protein